MEYSLTDSYQSTHEESRPCPHCGNPWLYDRVPRPLWVKAFLFFLPLKRYFCYKCKRRVYVWRR